MGCQTLWFSIQNILHFTSFCFVLKDNLHPLFPYKIQPYPIPVLEKLAKAPFLCPFPASKCQNLSFGKCHCHLGIRPDTFVEEVYPIVLLHYVMGVKPLEAHSYKRDILAKYAISAFTA